MCYIMCEREFAPIFMAVNPKDRHRVLPAALAREWAWNRLSLLSKSLSLPARLGESNIAPALHASESWHQPVPQVNRARQDCKCISGEIRTGICVFSGRLKEVEVSDDFVSHFKKSWEWYSFPSLSFSLGNVQLETELILILPRIFFY